MYFNYNFLEPFKYLGKNQLRIINKVSNKKKDIKQVLRKHSYVTIMSQSSRTCMTNSNETSVGKNSILVVGATGTLGRQIVRSALDEGYDVRCIVRPREIPADFLRDWGASVVNADLKDFASIPTALVGIHTVIDAATARPEESIQKIDWEGKVALVQTAQAMGIQRYIFFSILDCDKYTSVPLMNIKSCTEDLIRSTGMNFTIFRLCGFMQAIIGNYAVAILEERSVWGTNDKIRTGYIDAQDVAKMTLTALRRPETIGQTLPLAGPKAWTTQDVIDLCEKLSGGSKSNVIKVPIWLLEVTRRLLSCFQWARDAADRLAFIDIMQDSNTTDVQMNETYRLLGMDPSETLTLEQYLEEYFSKIIGKLKEVGAESRQTDFYV